MKLKYIYVVTKPGPKSVIEDVCFECDIHRLHLQYAGGMDPAEVVAFFDDPHEAHELATELLKKRDSGETP